MSTFDGSFGLVLFLDAMAEEHACELQTKYCPGADFVPTEFHVTLFHGRVQNVSEAWVQNKLTKIGGLLRQASNEVMFTTIKVYGDNFLFWSLERSRLLEELHREALGLADFLDRTKIVRAKEEGLRFTPSERANIKRYGYPLCENDYDPHFTLGYTRNGLASPIPLPQEERFTSMIIKPAFVEIGDLGHVERIASDLPS